MMTKAAILLGSTRLRTLSHVPEALHLCNTKSRTQHLDLVTRLIFICCYPYVFLFCLLSFMRKDFIMGSAKTLQVLTARALLPNLIWQQCSKECGVTMDTRGQVQQLYL
jgi:hypothetical protein